MRRNLALFTLTSLLALSGCRIISGVDIAAVEDDGIQEDMSSALDMHGADEGFVSEEMGSDLAEMGACEPTTEICDGEDNDCNGQIDEGCDDDGDGYCDANLTRADNASCAPGDCDDTRPDKHPGAKEPCPASEDLDCDGELRAYSATLTALQPIIPPGSIGPVEHLTLERGPNETFGLFWIESNALEAQVKFRRLGANGQPLSDPVTLSRANEVAHTYTPVWHDASDSWVVVSKSYGRDAYNYVHHVDTFSAEGVKKGARQVVATSEVGGGFLSFFTNHEIVKTGDTILILYTTTSDGLIDVFARSFDPATRELGDSLRLYGDLGLYQLSWVYMPPVEGEQHGRVVFKETEGMTKNPRLTTSFEVLQLRLGATPNKSIRYVNLDAHPSHHDLVKLGDELGLYFYEPRDDTPQNGRDYRLFLQKVDENFTPTGARLELDPIATRLSTSARVDEDHVDLLYYTAPSVQETRHIAKRLRLDTFEILSEHELTSYNWGEDYNQLGFIYTPGATNAQSRQHTLHRRSSSAAKDLPPYKVAAFNREGQLLGEYDLFTNIMTVGELETPQESRARLLDDGTLEWLGILYDPETQERAITISRILPDGSPDGPHLFSPPIHGNFCAASFVEDEVVCVRENTNTIYENSTLQSCDAELRVYRGDASGATIEESVWEIPHLQYKDNMDRDRCIAGYSLNSASATIREDGTLVYLAKKRGGYDVETGYLTGADVIIEISPQGELTTRELRGEGTTATPRVYEVDDARKLLIWVNQQVDHKLWQQWVTSDYTPLEESARELALPMAPTEDGESSILPFYPREEVVHGENHWFFYALNEPRGTHTFWAQASPLDISAPLPPPIALGALPSTQDYRLNPLYVTHVGSQVHLSFYEQNTTARASRAYVITFDTSTQRATTPQNIAPMHEDLDSYASYPGIFTEDDGSLIVLFVGLTEQLFEFYDAQNILRQQLSLSLQTLSQHSSQLPPFAIRGWRLADGSIRWPIWSSGDDHAALINLTCE